VIPGENVAINRAITTHTVNAQSVPEPALLDINTPRTLDRVCREIIARYSSVFTGANKKATPGKPKVAVSQGLEVLSLLEQAEIVKNVQAHKAEFIAEYDLSSPTQLDIEVPTAIVEPLHIVAAKVRLIYE
jgi:phage tail sheath gpL-like